MNLVRAIWRTTASDGKDKVKHYVTIPRDYPDRVFYETLALTKHPEDYGDAFIVLRSINGYCLIGFQIWMTVKSVRALNGAVEHLKMKYGL